ncbi:hypothetical protein DHEL01_v207952 [Diaporthe helianthi]|uniref:L-ornithine N(5)-monooxygenase [NAD(P)H] n=1 Tax=Diaporthe helianthi TaxID=158607 RepID=A0A2P5HTR2_DIAHE|nr:hypothetical protein DHEL01_v207952 [Diaporthe helianthi]
MVVFDEAASVGGTWAKERLYPGLKTNNLLGSYEFSHFPMTPGRFDVQEGHHIPGQAVHEYLTQFAEQFDLSSRLQLRQRVETAELLDNGSWSLRIISTDPGPGTESRTVVTKRLVVATGLTSKPFIPKFAGDQEFNRPLFHAKELRDRTGEIEKARSVVVLGGNKSAWDTCFFAANSGAHVHMVMRPDGGGPSWVWPVVFSPFNISVQRLATTRFFTWFDPCIWGESRGAVAWIRWALHGTRLGRAVVSKFWNTLQGYAQRAHGYDGHPETQKLRPWVDPFWMGNSLSIHNYASSWFELVREGKITVHIAGVSSLSDGSVHLSNGEILGVDAFVCCTGWATEPAIRFLPEDLKPALGLQRSDSIEEQKMRDEARAEIFSRLPALRAAPTRRLPPGTSIPADKEASVPRGPASGYQHYRFLVPPEARVLEQRNIAFIGSHLALSAIMIAQLQALWITAYFMDKLPHLMANTLDHDREVWPNWVLD